MGGTQLHESAVLRLADGSLFGLSAPPVLPGPFLHDSARDIRIVARAGRPAADPADEAAHWRLRTAGPAALDAAVRGPLDAGVRLCLRPHAEDVLSDAPSTLSFLRRHESAGGRLEVLIAPADLIAAEMLPSAADHYLRLIGAFAGHPALAGFILEDVTVEGGAPRSCSPGAGLLPAAAWAAVFEAAAGVPVLSTPLGTPPSLRALGWRG